LNASRSTSRSSPSRSDCAARNSRPQGAARVLDSLRPRCARLTALTAGAATRVLAAIDGRHPDVLDDGGRRRYCLIIFAGCCSQPPPYLPMWSTFESPVSDHDSFATFQTTSWLSVVATSRPRTDNRLGLRLGLRPGADPTVHHVQSSRCHGGTPVRSRCVGNCAQRAHHREHQRHRRSEWAGVSWPKDDDHERGAANGTGLARMRGPQRAPTTPQTLHSMRSSARWRDRPPANASS
jgi:hypothetical protein